MDRHSESFELLNQKVTETPIQVSLLLRLASGRVSPFLLGSPGWYRRKIEPIDGPDLSVSTTDFGWHAGGGLEILPNISASTVTTVLRSSTSTTTTTRDWSVGYFRATGGRCGRLEPPCISRAISAFTSDNTDSTWTPANEGELPMTRMAKTIVGGWAPTGWAPGRDRRRSERTP